jgi:hypothetical protein
MHDIQINQVHQDRGIWVHLLYRTRQVIMNKTSAHRQSQHGHIPKRVPTYKWQRSVFLPTNNLKQFR